MENWMKTAMRRRGGGSQKPRDLSRSQPVHVSSWTHPGVLLLLGSGRQGVVFLSPTGRGPP
jgi:hypothetical protein